MFVILIQKRVIYLWWVSYTIWVFKQWMTIYFSVITVKIFIYIYKLYDNYLIYSCCPLWFSMMLAEHFLLLSNRACLEHHEWTALETCSLKLKLLEKFSLHTFVGHKRNAYQERETNHDFTLLIQPFYCIKYTYLLPWVMNREEVSRCQVEVPYDSEVWYEMLDVTLYGCNCVTLPFIRYFCWGR